MKSIIMSADSIKAMQDNRKTQTRRVIKIDDAPENWKISIAGTSIVRTEPYDVKLPRYAAGDILWVRETWAPCATIDSWIDGKILYVYKADYAEKGVPWKWRPSIFMPREAARIFLRVTNAKVERLQSMKWEDIEAEGIKYVKVEGSTNYDTQDDYYYDCDNATIDEFIKVWDSLNAKRGYPFKSNPWVEKICFKVISREEAERGGNNA